jgi:hypothetical protein
VGTWGRGRSDLPSSKLRRSSILGLLTPWRLPSRILNERHFLISIANLYLLESRTFTGFSLLRRTWRLACHSHSWRPPTKPLARGSHEPAIAVAVKRYLNSPMPYNSPNRSRINATASVPPVPPARPPVRPAHTIPMRRNAVSPKDTSADWKNCGPSPSVISTASKT